MIYKIEVFNKPEFPDVNGSGLKKDVIDLGIKTISDARVSFLFQIEGDLSEKDIQRVCTELLCDPVTQEYRFSPINPTNSTNPINSTNPVIAEVWFKHGVTDNVGESTKIGIHDLGLKDVKSVKTGTKYIFTGINKEEAQRVCEKLLSNKVVQRFEVL